MHKVAHKNKVAYKIQFNPKAQQLKRESPLDDLCEDCQKLIQWKLKFGKYKKITQPRRCCKCGLPQVYISYRVACEKCSQADHLCPKCLSPLEKNISAEPESQLKQGVEPDLLNEMQTELKKFREREKRTILRRINKSEVTWSRADKAFIDQATGEQIRSAKMPAEDVDNEDDEEEEDKSESDSMSDYDA